MNFYSEYGEDRWIAENLKLPDRGFYVDVGCAVPGSGSNTAFLRDRGWRGLVIDANPAYRPHWRSVPNALFLSGIISDSPIVCFNFKEIAGHSRVEQGANFFATGRLDLLMVKLQVKQIDLLSVDVEGHEYEVLKSLGSYIDPKIIISEFATAGKPDDFRVFNHLLSKPAPAYREIHRTHSNHIFERTP